MTPIILKPSSALMSQTIRRRLREARADEGLQKVYVTQCSVCEGGLDYHDVTTFRSIWNQMDTDTRSHCLFALHQREVDPGKQSAMDLGKRVCIEGFLQLLGTSKRANYRQVQPKP